MDHGFSRKVKPAMLGPWNKLAVAAVALGSLTAMTIAFSTPQPIAIHHMSPNTFKKSTALPILTRLESQNDTSAETSSTILKGKTLEQNFTVTFPPFPELLEMRRGDCAASRPLQIQEHEFRVMLYPRGGGHSSSYTALDQKGAGKRGIFSMLQSNWNDAGQDRVGVYLQYLPKSEEDTVDATFNLRLKGRQSSGPRFDVDWTAGMRFVPMQRGSLNDGTANDFGAHMMQSFLLEEFLGGEDSEEKLEVEVKVQIYSSSTELSARNAEESNPISFKDIRETDDPNKHNTENVRVGKIVVPVIQSLSQRPRMFKLGVYPGVEYRLMRILHPETGEDVFTSMPGAEYELKPIYPLVPLLERQWPVRVNESELPKLYTMNMYNVISALASLFTAVTGLTTALFISQLISFFYIPSKSMDPTLRVGDVLLVEKVTPRVLKNPYVGDVVLFNPNTKLKDIVTANGGRISDRDLFVKRVAAGPGDYVSVDPAGIVSVNGAPALGARDLCEEEPLRLIQRYVKPVDKLEIKNDEVFVLGDCSSVSVDSRVWGPLDKEDLVGKPILRIWPLERLGFVPAIPSATSREEIVDSASIVTQWAE